MMSWKLRFTTENPNTWISLFIGGFINPETSEYQFRMEKEIFKLMVENPEYRGPYYVSVAKPDSYDFADVFPWRAVLINDQEGDVPTPRFKIKYVSIQN